MRNAQIDEYWINQVCIENLSQKSINIFTFTYIHQSHINSGSSLHTPVRAKKRKQQYRNQLPKTNLSKRQHVQVLCKYTWWRGSHLLISASKKQELCLQMSFSYSLGTHCHKWEVHSKKLQSTEAAKSRHRVTRSRYRWQGSVVKASLALLIVSVRELPPWIFREQCTFFRWLVRHM